MACQARPAPVSPAAGVQLTQDAYGRATTDSRCIRCDRVDGFPCLVGAKADAEWAVIRPALAAHPNLTLMTRTTVERLLTDTGGRAVTGVTVTLPDGSPHVFTADIVVLSAGAINDRYLSGEVWYDKERVGAYRGGLAGAGDPQRQVLAGPGGRQEASVRRGQVDRR